MEDRFVTELESKPVDGVVIADVPEDFPAVNFAYDFVVPSYQLLVSRFEAADNRLTALLTLTITLTLAVPILAQNVHPKILFSSPFFVLGIILFLLSSAAGICGRVMGE